jgi:hypothetical protein
VVNLVFAIFLTIFTNPGSIPLDSEWDMPDEMYLPASDDIQETKAEDNFDNQEIIED